MPHTQPCDLAERGVEIGHNTTAFETTNGLDLRLSGTARAHEQVRERYAFVAAGESIGPDRGDVVELVRSGALGVDG